VHERNITGVLVTHDLRMAATADRIVRVADGLLTENQTVNAEVR
jgi:predicted ABC-type transport system involved in lysophospholipase L1 biosynthesis ATPase subunit